jgi:hypothetical protein
MSLVTECCDIQGGPRTGCVLEVDLALRIAVLRGGGGARVGSAARVQLIQ